MSLNTNSVPVPASSWYEALNLLSGNEKAEVLPLIPNFSHIFSHIAFFIPQLSEANNIESIHKGLENYFCLWKQAFVFAWQACVAWW